jgi:Sulfotransferase family
MNPASQERDPVLDEPVIVLTSARSGSTLLRLILDTHPDLACPPETNIVKTCAQIAGAFGVTTGYTGEEPQPAARDAIRAMVTSLFGDYLRQRDRLRWCDKSLATAPFADWLLKMYPKARFICLYRHCMDAVHSGLEASPWGLSGYGFEQFTRVHGGNSVSALVAYWIEHTRRIAEFEKAHGDRCVRVHYEQLVTNPEQVAAEVFEGIGARPAPGITERCFGGPPPSLGPGDHKIRATGKITADSVGQGIRIPVDTIPPAQLLMANHLLTELGYTQVDEAWSRSACPPPPFAAQTATAVVSESPASLGDEVARMFLDKIGGVIQERATAGLRTLSLAGTPDEAAPFKLVAYHTERHQVAECWRVDPVAKTIQAAGIEAGASWMLTGDVETWLGVIADRVNMSSCIRTGALRYVDLSEPDRPEQVQDELAQLMKVDNRLALARRVLCLSGFNEEAG